MANENLQIDENGRNVLGAITNDASEFIKNLRVNPSTGRLLVDAAISSTNTSIGSTIPGGTAGSILFLGAGSTLAQDNANLFYDDTNNFVGFGTNTPDSTLEIDGTFHYVDGNQSNGFVLTSDASGNATWQALTSGSGTVTSVSVVSANGFSGTVATATTTPAITLSTTITGILQGNGTAISAITVGTGLTFLGGTLSANAGSAYNVIQNNGVSVTQRTTINLSTLLTASDVASKTAITINTTNLANDSTFITTLTSNVTFQGDIISIINNSGSSLTIDLATQVGTSVLPLANGGTQTALSDPGADTLFGWDATDGSAAFFTIGSGLSYDHTSHTLSSSGSGDFNLISTVTISSVSIPDSTETKIAEWTGLTGDTQDVYEIEFEVAPDSNLFDAGIISIRLNDDAGNNYTSTLGSTFSNAPTSQIDLFNNVGTVDIGLFFGTVQIKASKTIAGTIRATFSQTMAANASSSSTAVENRSGFWSDTTNEITSIQIYLLQTSGSSRNASGLASLYRINR